MTTLERSFSVIVGKRVMPRKLRLTWQPGVKGQPGRWKKIYKKKAHYFDGGRGKSDHEAYDKANAEWEKLKVRIDAESPKPHHAKYERSITEWEDVLACSHQHGDNYMAETATIKLAHLRKNQTASNPPPVDIADTFAGQFILSIRDPAQLRASQAAYVSALLGNAVGQRLANGEEDQRQTVDSGNSVGTTTVHAEPLTPAALKVERAIWQDRLATFHKSSAPSGDTLKTHVDRYLAQKSEEEIAGQISKGRVNNLRKHLQVFVEWAGHGTLVNDITSQMLFDFRSVLLKKVKSGTWATKTAHEQLGTVKSFVHWLSEVEAIDALPKILQGQSRALTISIELPEIVVYEKEEIATLLAQASDRTKLYILLMLNCGMTQKDIADLQLSEIDWQAGRIIRKRSKTKSHKKVPTVNYRLWPETLKLLEQERNQAKSGLALLNKNGVSLYQQRSDADGGYGKNDNIHNAFERLRKKMKIKGKSLITFKKTSASLLHGHHAYSDLADLFLGHAPRTMAQRHYAQAPQDRFDEAVTWLGEELGIE